MFYLALREVWRKIFKFGLKALKSYRSERTDQFLNLLLINFSVSCMRTYSSFLFNLTVLSGYNETN